MTLLFISVIKQLLDVLFYCFLRKQIMELVILSDVRDHAALPKVDAQTF